MGLRQSSGPLIPGKYRTAPLPAGEESETLTMRPAVSQHFSDPPMKAAALVMPDSGLWDEKQDAVKGEPYHSSSGESDGFMDVDLERLGSLLTSQNCGHTPNSPDASEVLRP